MCLVCVAGFLCEAGRGVSAGAHPQCILGKRASSQDEGRHALAVCHFMMNYLVKALFECIGSAGFLFQDHWKDVRCLSSLH